ncbi:MAG: nicotinamide-nucleotide amidohydrolase family protein [Planctomycetota bacterium]|jgi:nicotinamide-nucleotide amidase
MGTEESAPRAAVVVVGEEILRGEIVDRNSAWLGRRLTGMGFRVRAGLTAADREEEIVSALRRAAELAEAVVVTGGLGPTGDDLSAAAAAAFAGVELVESAEAIAHIAGHLACGSAEVTGTRRKMAMVPAGADVYANPEGSAPGIHIRVPGSGSGVPDCAGGRPPSPGTPNAESPTRDVFLLPGVPREMQAIFDASIAPALEELFPARPARRARLLHLCGWPESRADSAARELLLDLPRAERLEFGTKLGSGWVSLRLSAEGDGAGELVDRAASALAERFGESLWGEGPEASLAEAAAAELLGRGLTLALAESCTGGLVASRLVAVPGVSAALSEALVTYSNEAKTRLLGVDTDLIRAHGAVSRECAEAMARGLRTKCGADITLAVTGIAGPEGGTPAKPAGTVHFAVCGPGGVNHDVQRFGGGRSWVRERAASHALWLIRRTARQTSDR